MTSFGASMNRAATGESKLQTHKSWPADRHGRPARRLKRSAAMVAFVAVAVLTLGSPAAAQTAEVADQYDRVRASGAMNMVVLDNIFIFVCAVLVLLMQVGFALVEAGLTRAKNAANIMMKNMMDVCIGMLVFGLVGWGIAYPGDFNGVFGSAGFGIAGLSDLFVDISPESIADDGFYPLAVPVDFLFQVAFAATAATIVSGAVAERTKFIGYILYSIGLTAVLYPIVVSWKWGGGWLDSLGFIDFAGSGVVHMTGGFAALVAAYVLGPRSGKFDSSGRAKALPGHSVPLAMTGVLILFIGWFGFNPGSQLQADMAVPLIAVYTAFAGAAGGLGGMMTSWITGKKPDVSMAGNGILAGLVAICSGIGEFSWLGTVVTGFIAGCLVVVSVLMVEGRRIDDPVGAFSVHGVCGFWGLIATGLFATTSPVNGATESAGVFYGGGFGLLFDQIVGGLAIAAFVTAASAALFLALRSADLFRVTSEDEAIGLDLCEHGSPGYGPELLTTI